MFGLFLQALSIGFSGAIMPGPLLTVTIAESARRGYSAGPLIVLGHAILEILLIMGLVLGLGNFIAMPVVGGVIGLAGGIVLLWMGQAMVRSSRNVSLTDISAEGIDSFAFLKGKTLFIPILAGLIISLINPYWSLWWATIGLKLVGDALHFQTAGLLVFFCGHILADLIWYTAVAGAISKGKKLFSDIFYRRTVLICGVFLVVLAVKFMADGAGKLWPVI